MEARIGRAKAGNFSTLIMLRVKELATAEMMTDQLPKVEVFTLMSVSGVDDSSDPGSGIDFKSRNFEVTRVITFIRIDTTLNRRNRITTDAA